MSGPIGTVEVYWRPGCPFCSSLQRGLRRAGVATQEVNIWAGDPAAAARVRDAANGNETVPTVFIGDTVLIVPRARDVVAVLARDATHLLPEAGTTPLSPGHRLLRRLGFTRRAGDQPGV